MMHAPAETGEHAAVAGGDGMVDIRLGHGGAEQVQQRQQHGAGGMERLGERHVRELLQAQLGELVHEGAALQQRERMDASVLHKLEEHVPIRLPQAQQLTQSRELGCGQTCLRLTAAQTQSVIEENLADLHHVRRQLVDELPPRTGRSAHRPQHELVLWHGLDIGVRPGGHTAVHVGVAPFQHQADAHGPTPPSARCARCRSWRAAGTGRPQPA